MTMDEHQDRQTDPPQAEMGAKTYSDHAVRGSAWTLAQTIASKGLMIVTQIILAWFLLPSDFGLAGYAISIAAVLTVLGPLPLLDLLTRPGLCAQLHQDPPPRQGQPYLGWCR